MCSSPISKPEFVINFVQSAIFAFSVQSLLVKSYVSRIKLSVADELADHRIGRDLGRIERHAPLQKGKHFPDDGAIGHFPERLDQERLVSTDLIRKERIYVII